MATTAIRFDASGDRLRISSGLWDYNSAYTMAAWVYISTDRGVNYQSIFCRYGGGSQMDQVYIDNSGEIATFIANSASTDTTGASITAGTWYYIACVRENNASFKVYIDGSSTATIADTRSVSGRTDAAPKFDLSTNDYSEWYNGRMAFCRVWTAALSNAEINAEMDSTSAVKTSSLWGDWPLQADDDDDSGNARHFTTSGTVTYSEAGPDIGGGGTAYTQSVAGTLTTAGALAKRAAKRPAGTLTTAGVLAKRTSKSLAGSLTTAGVLAKRTSKSLAGSLTTAGAIVRSAAKSLAGTLTAAGGLVANYVSGSATFSQVVGGTLTTAGTLAKRTSKSLAGTLATAGSISRAISKLLSGTLTTAGGLLREWFSPSAAKLDVTLTDARVYTCTVADAHTHTCTVADALTYRVTLGDSTT